ncbi:hypothetical protein DMC30DRAFT_414204 [Rhodotorula diobovata]|uniref:Uncharacterized protein n=1 Tax=Rhodotorula diobovata TaxID=5288 RepID=A0A5C5G4M3_9BASI|nr:hypothetical protein DMC30DRAFT_414204 [Rhodotorula diobovata]
MGDARPLSTQQHSLAHPPLAPSPYPPPLARAQTQTHHYPTHAPPTQPPFHHHSSEGTHPCRPTTTTPTTLSRDRTLRAPHPANRALRSGGYPSHPQRPASAAPAPYAHPSSTRASHNPHSGGPRSPSYPPPSPAPTGPYPPIVASPTTLSPPVPAPPHSPYAGFARSPPPGVLPTQAVPPRAYAASVPPLLPAGPATDAASRRRPSQAELEQEAVERAMQQGLETEQRRLAALAHEEERLVLLTLEESTASAALEQLRANALERERTQAEERALRDAVLRSRSEAEGQRREEERRRREEECEVLRVMAVSRRESEEGKGKGKGKVVVDEGEEAEREEEDELDRREREALELAMQLSLQEEEKRRIWRGGLSVANADDAPDAIVVAPSSGSAAPTFVAHPPAVDPHAASYFPTSSSSSAFPSGEDPADPAPPAYELAPHAHELDSPSDVIIGPGRPLPLPPAHAPARLRRPSVRQDIKAAYPSFAPYAREGDGGGGGRSGSVVPSESGGALSMAASAGSFEEEEVVAVGSSWSGVGAREGGQGGFVEEPERLGWGGEGLRIGEEEDPFDDRFGEEAEQQEEEDEGAGRLVTGEGDEARRDEQLQERDLFAEVLARRATQRLRSTEAYPARPVVAVDRVDPAAWTSADEARTTEDDQRTPTGPDPPALARVAQPVSAPSTPEPSSFLEPPASTPARIPSNSAPTSPTSSSSHLRSDPSSGGFVEDLGSLVPFADEHVLRDVRWGFVDDETSSAGRYPRLEHEGDFPRGAQLSAVRGADGAQAYRAFAVEARTWQGLLIFLMWHGNSRFEAAPSDLEKDKAGLGLRVAVSVDFFRSGRQASSAVSIRPPRVRVRLSLLLPPEDPALAPPARRTGATGGFALAGPAALEPVAPSVRLVLAAQPVLPLTLADLATLLSRAHTASRSYMRLAGAGAGAGSATMASASASGLGGGGGSAPLGPVAEGRVVLAQAVDLFRRLNGEEVPRGDVHGRGGGGREEEEEEVSVLDRLKARLRRRRGPRVIEGGGRGRARAETGGGALPEGATLITPFALG